MEKNEKDGSLSFWLNLKEGANGHFRSLFYKGDFVDEFIDRLRNGDRELYGWQNTRSWLYIDDFVDAFTQLIFKEEAKNDIFNIGSNDETEVIVLAEKIAELLDINPSEIVRKDS